MAAQIADCPGEELVLDYADGRLSADEQQRLELHFDDCAACTSVLAALAHRTTLGHRDRSLARIHPGTTVDRYVVRRQLGRGAMGVVFEAYDPELDRRVAIKVIRPPPSGIDEHERARVLHEARALARLSHPNVVPVLTVGTRGDEIFVVMELVEGTTLREWLSAEPREHAEIVDAFVAAGHGLAAAHRAGLVHRDFKPDNVLVGDDTRVRVIDFGLAHLVVDATSAEESSNESQPTRLGAIVGTPAYMPPEQLLGGDVDPRADQFALAASIYEALAGRRPWENTSLVRDEGRTTARGISRPLLRVLDRALSTRPEQRYATTEAFVRAVERASRGSMRRIAIAAAMGSVAIAGWLAAASHDEACDVAIAPTWADPNTRDRVTDAFADGPRHAAGSSTTVVRELDRRLAAYEDLAASACDDEALLACLELRRLELDTTVDLLAAGEDDMLLRAVDLVTHIEPASTCDESVVASSDHPAMLADLTRAFAIGSAGRFDEGLALAESVWSRAAAPEDARVRARAAFVIGGIHQEAARFEEAAQWMESAYFGATEIADDEGAVDAALELAEVLVRLNRFEDADRWLAHAEAVLDRQPTLEAKAQLASARGRVAQQRGQAELSLQRYEEALELRRQATDDDLSLAFAFEDVAVMRTHTGRPQDAIESHERVIEIRERILGERHPLCAAAHNNLAMALMELGDLGLAYDHYEHAREVLLEAYGPEHLYYASALGNLGALWGVAGEPAVAAIYFADSLPGYERLGQHHPDYGTALMNLGFAQLQLGNYGEAVELLDHALAVHESALGHEHPTTRGTAASLAVVHSELGNHARVVALIEHALMAGAPAGWEGEGEAKLRAGLEESRAQLGAASTVSPR